MTEDTIRIIRSMSLPEIEHFIQISREIPTAIRSEVTRRLNALRNDAERMMSEPMRMDTRQAMQP